MARISALPEINVETATLVGTKNVSTAFGIGNRCAQSLTAQGGQRLPPD
jgi:hypothetical protein